MNKLIIILLLFATQFVHAGQFIIIDGSNGGIKNPQIRVCRQVDGVFAAYDIANDNVGFCLLSMSAIGANDLVLASQGIRTKALSTYLQNTAVGIASCAQAGASDQTSSSLNGVMCRFNDNSWIALAALSQGKGSAMNAHLDNALRQLGY